MRAALCQSARMTSGRLFLTNCLIWLLTLASPAGAGAVTMADLQTGVGDLKENSDLVDGGLGAALLHGGIGCAANAAFDGSCASGFAVSFGTELIAGQLSANFEADPNMDARAQEAARMAFEQNRAALIGAFAGYITSGGNAVNVNQGASVARSAVANNRQLHVQEAELIGLYAGVFAREQGISVEEATALLTAETLIGISDDFAHLESDAAARAFLDALEQAGQVVDGQTLFGQLDRGSDEYLNSQQNYQYVSQLTDLYAGVPYQENADRARGHVAMALDVFDGSENRGVDTFLAYQAAQDSVYFLNNGTTWTGQSQDAAATYINTSIHSGRLMAAGDSAAEMFNVSGFTIGAINGLHAGGHDALIGQVSALSDEDLGAFILGQQGGLLEFGLAVASGSSFRTTLSERLAAFGANRRSNFLSGGGTNSGRFSEIQARNADEAQFLRNAEATFGESTTWTSVTRHRGELVVQRSDIELSPQNITRMQNGQAPFVRNANGDWEPLQLHHVGRETGQMIEVTRSQNQYDPATGGPLHIPGPGSPIRQPNYSQTYWQERYQGFVASGQIVE